ncbi:MAG: hypothetical protein WAZ34_00725 [Rhodocyclaceae bacterium]
MSTNSSRVFAAWAALSPTERNEVVKLINEYQKAMPDEKDKMTLEHLNESSQHTKKSLSVNFGPLSGGCPMCGK